MCLLKTSRKLSKKELDRIPVIANVDFEHTPAMITFPIGGGQGAASSKPIIQNTSH